MVFILIAHRITIRAFNLCTTIDYMKVFGIQIIFSLENINVTLPIHHHHLYQLRKDARPTLTAT